MSTFHRQAAFSVMLLIVLMMTIGARPTVAEPWPAVDQETRLAELERELQSLRCQLLSHCQECPTSQSRRSGCHLYAGSGVVFTRPHFKESFQNSQINLTSGQQTLHPFSFDYDVTPKVWLGARTANGLGIHADYWQYHHSSNRAVAVADGSNIFASNATTVIFPATIVANDPGEVLVSDSSLETQIVTLMGTLSKTTQSIEMRAGVGLRYALLDQELATSVSDSLGIPQGLLSWSRRFEGLGPAADVEARRRLGESGFSLLAAGGGSLLFGSKTLHRLVLGDVGVPPAAPLLRLDDADEVVGVGNLNFGLEWAQEFCNRTEVSIQGRYDGQLWAEAGAPTLGFLGFEGFGLYVELRR